MDAEALNNLLFFVRLGVVTVFLWVASRLFDLWLTAKRKREKQDAYISAIFAEVDFNTMDVTNFLNSTIPLKMLHKLFSETNLIPHLADARHTDMYLVRRNEIHYASPFGRQNPQIISKLVRYYAELEKLSQQISGLSKESFKTISPQGKTNTIAHLYRTAGNCEVIGTSILGELRQTYSHLNLERVRDEWWIGIDVQHDGMKNLKERQNSLQEKIEIYRSKNNR